MINRSILIVRARKPFVHWVKSLPDSTRTSVELLNEDSTVYLAPAFTFECEQDQVLSQIYETVFEDQLETWWTDTSEWPAKRDLKTFHKWFEVEFHSSVLDLVENAPLLDDT